MKNILLLTVLFYLSFLAAANAGNWSSEQQKQNRKKVEIWSRFSDTELCKKINLSKKGTSMRRVLNAERIKRHIKCEK